mmetsp:Transcript_33615/g.101495  ORF Transcript_33615/g.101495 Transcript_33615/m.101495 type:complete len:235 (-) Transcript_33615:396-1100(-)
MRAVRPTRWMYREASRGRWKLITVATFWRSRPLAARSVARRCSASPRWKRCSACTRSPCAMLPWISAKDRPERPKTIAKRWAAFFVAQKMITPLVYTRVHRLRRTASRKSSDGAFTNSCSRVSATRFTAFALTRTGLTRASFASSSTEVLCVAEKSMVWRPLEQHFRTCMHSSRNPNSSSLSASSKMTISRSSMCTDCVFSRWSSMRPGVATTMSGWLRRELAWSWDTKPPATS